MCSHGLVVSILGAMAGLYDTGCLTQGSYHCGTDNSCSNESPFDLAGTRVCFYPWRGQTCYLAGQRARVEVQEGVDLSAATPWLDSGGVCSGEEEVESKKHKKGFGPKKVIGVCYVLLMPNAMCYVLMLFATCYVLMPFAMC